MVFPEAFIKRIDTQKYIDSQALMNALEEPSPVSIRVNSSKWKRIPLNSEPVPWSKSGYYLQKRPSFTLDPLFHSGCYYPQEASSMFLEEAFRQTAGSNENLRVLDLCGAPGGKSIILSDYLGKESLLIANEVIRQRASVLAETITKWGVSNTLVTQSDPSAFGLLTGYFDVILIDAPCSGEGMFRTQIAREEWSAENAAHCSERQKRILMDIWPALKENGLIIYSTCTFNPAENEENIKWLTDKHLAESVKLDLSRIAGIEEIDFEGISGYGFYPGKIKGDGFFISVIRKTEKTERIQVRSQKKNELKPSKEEISRIESVTDFSSDSLLKWGDEILSVPCQMDEYLFLFKNLKIVKPGTVISTVKSSDYLPSHEIAFSGKIKEGSFPAEEISLEKAIAFLRRDNLRIESNDKGWLLLTYNGVNIGFVKNLGNRVNNYFPVEWRIRMSLPPSGNENIINWR
jgi:16S rRNA C967 or C1407 C5-methylase (RsmB/RsmF family)/NOL1/NOP2/fmu family ribosome biogenesis protein